MPRDSNAGAPAQAADVIRLPGSDIIQVEVDHHWMPHSSNLERPIFLQQVYWSSSTIGENGVVTTTGRQDIGVTPDRNKRAKNSLALGVLLAGSTGRHRPRLTTPPELYKLNVLRGKVSAIDFVSSRSFKTCFRPPTNACDIAQPLLSLSATGGPFSPISVTCHTQTHWQPATPLHASSAQDSISAAHYLVLPFPPSNGFRQSRSSSNPTSLYQGLSWLPNPSIRSCGGRMSSRPTTPTTDDKNHSQQTETTRRTRSQTRQTQESRDMIATAQYQGHTPYLHPPHHSLQALHRHEQSTGTSQPSDHFAPPEFSFDTSYRTSAVPSAAFALTSGGVEGRREPTEEVKAGSYKHAYAQESDVSARLRHSPPPKESRGHPSTESDHPAEAPTVPQKKKRTRTLTTSNQSSVLLALLAKTPFPTTAEREEVGRAIGLTARKVQVWFQNQRQKQKKSGQTGSSHTVPQGAVTSAPLPLSHQPGFTAEHAARMGFHGQNSPPFTSSSIAPYPGSGGHDHAEPSPYNISPPPILPAPPRGQAADSYQPNTVYGRSFAEQTPYYSLHPGREGEYYPPPHQSATSGTSHALAGHATYVTSDFSDPFGHRSPRSREPSFGYPPLSQDPSVSDDQSRPTTSRGSQQYGPSPGDSWRSKPLPPLPEGGRPSTGHSLTWEHNSPGHGFRPPVPPSRSRAFSNPDPNAEGYGRNHTFTTAGGLISTPYGPSSRFYPPAVAPDSTGPNAYHAPSDYPHEDVQRLTHTSSGSVGDSFRYGDQYTSPGGISSSSSYSEAAGLGIPSSSQHAPSSVSYSPVEHRRTRLSYDSSLAGGSNLGKRPWSTEEGRPSKRARTDDGHASMPLRSSTRTLPPNSYQSRPAGLGTQGSHHMQLPLSTNPPVSRSEDLHRPYHYEPPTDSASGV